MRDHDLEYQDNQGRKYAYDFDTIIRRYLLKTLEPYFARKGTVLELGCYKGDMTQQILEYFPAITAVEAVRDLSEIVRRRFPARVDVVTGTFEEIRLDQRFDNIFLVHTLEHVIAP